MNNGERFWHHAGISDIRRKSDSYVVRIPDRLFRASEGAEILTVHHPVRWYLHAVIHTIICSESKLEEDDYEFVKSTRFRGGQSEFTCTVPKEFFKGFEGQGGPAAQPKIADWVNLDPDERLHFMWHEGMAKSPPRSCYVFTEAQFLARFEDSDLWDESLSEVPKFIS